MNEEYMQEDGHDGKIRAIVDLERTAEGLYCFVPIKFTADPDDVISGKIPVSDAFAYQSFPQFAVFELATPENWYVVGFEGGTTEEAAKHAHLTYSMMDAMAVAIGD